jgi:hypothetical protein
MSFYATCESYSADEKREYTKENFNKLRRLFNGEKVTLDGRDYNLKDSITSKYGDTDDPLGKRMFEEIVWRGTYKPAFDEYMDFTDGDFRRIRNEIIKESKNLQDGSLNFLEKYGFVKRGVMQKYAISKVINDKINQTANYERTQFNKYLTKHRLMTKLIRTEVLNREGGTKYWDKNMTIEKLEKLENDLILELNNPSSEGSASKVKDKSDAIEDVLKSKGGEVLNDLRLWLEGGIENIGTENRPRYIKTIEQDDIAKGYKKGDQVEIGQNVIEAGKVARALLDDMGKVMIDGMKEHKKWIRSFYLDDPKNIELPTKAAKRVKRYEETVDEQLKAIEDGIKDGNYFPHYLVENFVNMERISERLEKYKGEQHKNNINEDLSELELIFSEMGSGIQTPKTAQMRKSIPYENYLRNPLTVIRKYSVDAIAFNKNNYLKNLYQDSIKKLPKDGAIAEGMSKYIEDTYLTAYKGFNDRPEWVNKSVRTLTGIQFLSKLGFGIGTAARNMMSGMYYIQGVGNRAYANYLLEWRKLEQTNPKLLKIVNEVEQEQGFKFADMAADMFTEGLLPTEGVKVTDLKIDVDNDGQLKMMYKQGKAWRLFDSALTTSSGYAAVFQQFTENMLRKNMFRYSFMSKYKELTRGGLGETEAIRLSKNHGLDMVNKYAFEYAASQKAPIAGGGRGTLGAVGSVAFQFMHYPMSFLQQQSEILRKSKDAVMARQWNNPDMYIPLRFAGLYLFTEFMSGLTNLNLHRIMENDTVDRLKTFKDAFEGKEVTGRGFLGPTVGELYYYASLNDFISTPDNVIADIIVGYNDAYKMTDEQKRARVWSSLNVQASKLLNKNYKSLRNGNGWDLLMHEFGVYPTKHTRELRKKQPFATIFPPKKKKILSPEMTEKEKKKEERRRQEDELTKLYRAMGI